MGMLSDFFVATSSEGPTYAALLLDEDDEALSKFTVASHKGLTGLEVAGLHAILLNEPFAVSQHTFDVVSGEEDEGLIERFPDAFVLNLSNTLEGSLQGLSERWAVAIREEVSRDAAGLLPVIYDLKSLAVEARQTGKSLFIWYSI